MNLHPWTHRSKAESVMPRLVAVPYWGGRNYNEERVRFEERPGRVVRVEGGWLALGCYLPWSRQTELIDRRRSVRLAVLPGDWP